MQAVDEARSRPPRMGALANRIQCILDPHRHPVVEYETFTEPVLVSKTLLIVDDTAVQLEDLLKPLAPK